MAGSSATRGRVPPPPRGRRYFKPGDPTIYVVPRGGGRAQPVPPPASSSAARRARLIVADESRKAGETAGRAARATSRTLTRAGAAPPLGTSRTGFGGLLIYGFASIVALALLDALLRGRGPAGADVALRGLGQGIRKLFDPTDPIVGAGPPPAAAAGSTGSAASSGGATGDAGAGGFPVQGGKYQNDWGDPRSGGRTHKGTDIFAPRGTPVQAIDGGTVAVRSGGLGGIAVWTSGTWYYAHLDRVAPGLRDGSRVKPRQVIGYVGNTGNAAGGPPLLHLGYDPRGTFGLNWSNPYPVLTELPA